ncbi:hypothetical protein [Roseibium sp. M-1]
MLHTGDMFEARARAARHQELRRLARAIHTLMVRHGTSRAIPDTRPMSGIEIANDRGTTTFVHEKNRAA